MGCTCSMVMFFITHRVNASLVCVEFQIAALLKDNVKIQSNPEVPPSEDDTEIKKIKKVTSDNFGAVLSEKRKYELI